MDVEVNHKKNILDLSIYFFSSNIQHIRRMEIVYLILYLPFDHSWIIRQQNDHQQTDLCLWHKMEVCGHIKVGGKDC